MELQIYENAQFGTVRTTTIPFLSVEGNKDSQDTHDRGRITAFLPLTAGARISLLPVCEPISAMRKTKNGKM